jgi:aryl-alcohol dehydrogenase-like predicted oxidoreductase
MKNKLALGTVQFGLNYGIKNVDGQVSFQEANRILQQAKNESVFIIDTAQTYGNSEQVLGDIGLKDFEVTTKVSSLKNGITLSDAVISSLNRLRIETLYGVLFHEFGYWLLKPELWYDLQKIKSDGAVKKIGFSLYYPQQWDILKEKKIIPDILQIPMNLLNQQFLPYLEEFKQSGIEVHVRSAFSQGLLLMDPKDLPGQFIGVKPQLEALQELSEHYEVDKMSICLTWLWQNPYINYIIVGVDSSYQWEENLSAAKWCEKNSDKIKIDASSFNCNDDNIIDPSKWRI